MTENSFWDVNVFGGYDPELKKSALGNVARVYILQAHEVLNSTKLASVSMSAPLTTHTFISKTLENNAYSIRWYNNGNEIRRCGHGTLAASYIVSNLIHHKNFNGKREPQKQIFEPIIFKSFFNEILRCKPISNDVQDNFNPSQLSHTDHSSRYKMNERIGDIKLYALDFSPYDIETHQNTRENIVLASELKTQNMLLTPNQQGYLIAEAEKPDDVFHYKLNSSLIKKSESRAIIYFSLLKREAIEDEEKHLVIFRYFAPQHGVDEDRATGSAASILAQYLFERNNIKTTKMFQASPNNGGLIYTNASTKTVSVCGQVVLQNDF